MGSRKPVLCAFVAMWVAMAAGAAHANIYLAPSLAGDYASGDGADARFVKLDDAWHGSSVLWNEAAHQFGNGIAISNYGWGSGIWGLSDWKTLMALPPNQPPIAETWSGIAPLINYGNIVYNKKYDATWGAAQPLPDADMQTNVLTDFSGYIRITDAGLYNFGVLYGDGFFFNLFGANGELSISKDFLNPRDRLGFDDNLALDPGLYRFELGSYYRLEAGVVDLRWLRKGHDSNWSLVPTADLVTRPDLLTNDVGTQLPLPGTLPLILGALLPLALARRRPARLSQ